jgi:hypothetical protein
MVNFKLFANPSECWAGAPRAGRGERHSWISERNMPRIDQAFPSMNYGFFPESKLNDRGIQTTAMKLGVRFDHTRELILAAVMKSNCRRLVIPSGARLGAFEGRVVALGGAIGYTFEVRQTPDLDAPQGLPGIRRAEPHGGDHGTVHGLAPARGRCQHPECAPQRTKF